MMNKNYLEINRQTWDQRTSLHLDSKFYDLDAFLKGKCSLNRIELEQVGEVKGKSLLHLQCHFGQDTLSWARLGAEVTGVDLSPRAIEQAKSLNQSLGLSATFIESDVYQFGLTNTKKFDLVFTSYGVLCWLPDLHLWAQTIAQALKVGGEFHLVEFHPVSDLLGGYSYFPSKTPDIEEEGTYTENCAGDKSTVVTWPHSLSEVINALIAAGLVIEYFNEFPYSPYDCLPNLEFVENFGYMKLHENTKVPLIYAIKARKT